MPRFGLFAATSFIVISNLLALEIAIEVDNPTGANVKVVLPNSTVDITCVAIVNNFYAHFSWAAPNGAEVTFLLSNHVHSVISTAVTKDVGYGQYTCSANNYNMNEIVMVVFHIILAAPPKLAAGPEDKYAIEGDGTNIQFYCEFIFTLDADVLWVYEPAAGGMTYITENTTHHAIIVRDDYVNETLFVKFTELSVLNVRFSDRGNYSCIANNSLGDVSDSGSLTVQVTPTLVGVKITKPKETLVLEPVAIFCEFRGFPVPEISWMKNGREMNEHMRYITFHFPPELVRRGGRTDYLSPGYNGSIISLISMTGLSESLFHKQDDLIIVGVLYIPFALRQDSGNYSCVGSNVLPQTTMLSTVSDQVFLVVTERPDPPTNVSILDSGSTSLSVEWRPGFDGNNEVISFEVYYRNIDANDNFTLLITFPVSKLIPSHKGLLDAFVNNSNRIQPQTKYTVAIISCNSIACSDRSKESAPLSTKPPSGLGGLSSELIALITVIITFITAILLFATAILGCIAYHRKKKKGEGE